MNKAIILLPITIILSLARLQAQDAILSSGGGIESSSGSVYYSVGQVFSTPTENDEWLITPGVQQSQYVVALAARKITESIDLSVFPNPTSDNLILKTDLQVRDQSYVVYDLQGKIILNSEIDTEQTTINTRSLPSGIYLVKVLSKSRFLKSFKIIKN